MVEVAAKAIRTYKRNLTTYIYIQYSKRLKKSLNWERLQVLHTML
jgi:hypothetical protein